MNAGELPASGAALVREDLEAALWRAGCTAADVDAVLALADTYAEKAADDRIAGHVLSRSLGRQRLAEAVDAARGTGRRRPVRVPDPETGLQAKRREQLAEELAAVHGHTGGRRSSGSRRKAA